MAYSYSELDNKNLKWFPNDPTRATLLSVQIVEGKLRGLENLQIDFSYPITAIAGRNGSGKTTILALAACAFHSKPESFHLPGRKYSYYTLSDFFVQTSEETSVSGIQIDYKFLHDKWRARTPKDRRVGEGWQSRYKRKGGHWNKYDRRVKRTVIYLGIDRIVPHSEKNVVKNYRRLFITVGNRGWEDEVKEIVGRILGTDYDSFGHKQHSKYCIPIVKKSNAIYSGFNMGAGEESLFELFSIIKECPDGSLIIIDEIELGLHEDAQSRMINELKIIYEKRKFQITCTTHSPRILETLPPEGRIFLDRNGSKVEVLQGIATGYATRKLTGRQNVELDILVEDDSAKLIIETCLKVEHRSRIRVIPVGSCAAVMRHLASRHKEERKNVCVFLDGDKATLTNENLSIFLKSYENTSGSEEAKKWAEQRLYYLPGEQWPELWVISQKSDATISRLTGEFSLTREKIEEMLNAARRAGKHNEFHEAASILNFNKTIVAHQLIKSAFESVPAELVRINQCVSNLLK